MKKIFLSMTLAGTMAFSANAHGDHHDTPKAENAFGTAPAVLTTYADIAFKNYSDALKDAKALDSAIETFVTTPTEANFEQAKTAWLASRESYGQTEVFRLSNGPIDAEEDWVADAYGALEGQLNAWPLDENMIDYTIDAKGEKTSNNIIDTVGSFTPGGEDANAVDVTEITADALTALNENGGEANVSTGYHAIEFLLWGQDQDYANFVKDSITNGATTAGQRSLSDYTSDQYAKRRQAFLREVSKKLVNDLATVTSAWDKTVDGNKGLYRVALLGTATGDNHDKNIDSADALKQIIAGMGVFIKSELANERIAVAVLTPSEEDEHSCFSDNTHRDIVTNFEGFKNVLFGRYNGEQIGEGFIDKVPEADKAKILELVKDIDERIATVDKVAKSEAHFDYQIHPDSQHASNIVAMKNQMRKLGDMMIAVAKAHDVSLNEDDVTDAEETKL